MKKLLTFIALVVLGASTTFAQTSAAVPASKQATKKVAPAKSAKPATANKEVKKVSTTASSTKLKADGTPDMRYTENKAKKAAVAGPTKKDGTADMRYKANKAAASKAPAKKN